MKKTERKRDKKREKKALSARSRQILDVVYRLGEASAADIHKALPEIPSYSAVRSILRSLVDRGLIEHHEEGLRYVYHATVPKNQASRSAISNLLDTYFDGSPQGALQALIDVSRDGGYDLDLEALEQLVDQARREGR